MNSVNELIKNYGQIYLVVLFRKIYRKYFYTLNYDEAYQKFNDIKLQYKLIKYYLRYNQVLRYRSFGQTQCKTQLGALAGACNLAT